MFFVYFMSEYDCFSCLIQCRSFISLRVSFIYNSGLTVASINVNGLRDNLKREFLFDYIVRIVKLK